MNSIEDRLKIVMDGMSGRKFAIALGMSPTTVNQYLNGRMPPADFIALVCGRFSVDATWLLTGEGDMKPSKASYPLAEGFKSADFGGELAEGFVQVPRYEVAASAGGGALIYSEQIVDHLSFKAEWIHNALGVSVKDLALINVTGDSMEPTLSEGDLILVDMSYRGMKDNAIYVLQLNGSLLVKRLQHRLEGGVLVKSDNPVYDPGAVSGDAIDSLNIVGRVVWCGRRM